MERQMLTQKMGVPTRDTEMLSFQRSGRRSPSFGLRRLNAYFGIDKFNIVVSHLNLEVIEQVEETLSQQNYFVLKEALIQHYTLLPDLRLQKIFAYEDLGDKTPPQVLKALRTLAGPELLPEESLRLIWLRKLPANISAVIAAETDLSLQVLAKKADTIADTLTEVSACSEFNYSQD
ncbi:uncharacterized protein LOC126355548 [Schistocerca gregaria]|uniref:uncharacterized protein LOC126355548 n=1 Tax=Schistocerca gregaria TaxID=7010 RepID=UPI00211DD4E6|nr:uncharacterized protein LOC126355548 [Schistocerca gregaria]